MYNINYAPDVISKFDECILNYIEKHIKQPTYSRGKIIVERTGLGFNINCIRPSCYGKIPISLQFDYDKDFLEIKGHCRVCGSYLKFKAPINDFIFK